MQPSVVTWAAFAVGLLLPKVGRGCSLSCVTPETPLCAHSWTLGFQNFTDKCQLMEANTCGGGDWTVIHAGACFPAEFRGCPLICQEVCGYSPTLGFRNIVSLCFLRLIALYTDFKLAHPGPCTPVELPPPTCPGACPLLLEPVCGYNPFSGYRTFPNPCSLGQENQCNYGHYFPKHSGACTQIELDSNCPRACTKEYNPVCGLSKEKGYKTFANLCTFYNLTHCSDTDSDYKLAHTGECTTDEKASFCQPGFCEETGEPVCASSLPYYRTFPNKCLFYVENSCKYGDFLPVHDGECTASERDESCAVNCTQDVLPVCGYSNARGYKTFPNRCIVNYDNACSGTDYGAVHLGECKKEELGLICKKSYCQKYKGLKVCGVSSNKGYATFDNQCALFADNICKHGDYKLAHFGECSIKELGLLCLPEFCQVPGKPVCGYSAADGYFTFPNLCFLNRQNICNGGGYSPKHPGKCTEFETSGKCPPVCLANYSPVCGYSANLGFKTFGNLCQLIGENGCSGTDYHKKHNGQCLKPELATNCKKVCPFDYQPVCGLSPTKGLLTFPNECQLNYNVSCFNSDFKLEYIGECGPDDGKPPVSCDEEVICTEEYSPVCAYSISERVFKKFPNKCIFDAKIKCVNDSDLIFAHYGDCSSDEEVNNCKRTCPPDEAPVCGRSPSLGYKSFKNVCNLLLGLSCFRSDFSLAYKGRCNPPDVPPTCTSLCLAVYSEPLCTFSPSKLQFTTFPNSCFLNQAVNCAFEDYIIAHAGNCTTFENDCLRPCPLVYSPICGYSPTRGYKTFGNVCTFIRDLTCKGCDYVYIHKGKCKYPEGPQEGCPVLSSPDVSPVCSYSIGTKSYRTFRNEDLLKSENQCFYGDYVYVHHGNCTKNEKDPKCYRKCKFEYVPVCGKHLIEGFRTFPSPCELEVANKCDGAGYSFVHNGKCSPAELGGKCHHVCPLYYIGICGYSKIKDEHRTFPNICFLDRENTCSLSDYKTVRQGKCTPAETGNKCTRECKPIYSPVCAKNSKNQFRNFPNFCLLDRDNSCFYHDFNVVHPGECFRKEMCLNCNKS